MRYFFFYILISSTAYSQISAVTENGDEVFLYDDNTWIYKNENLSNKSLSSISNPIYNYDKNSTFLVKSNTINMGVYIDPKKWSFNKSLSDEYEYEFELKNEELFAMMINEKIEMPLENLKELAFDNFSFAADDARIVNQEFRSVNDLLILMLHMEGKIEGLSVFYYGYYFSSDKGTTQFVTYTTTNLFDAYKSEIEKFLNGLINF